MRVDRGIARGFSGADILSKRLLDHLEYASNPQVAGGLLTRADSLEKGAAQICEWLHALTCLVEPELGSSV